MPLRAERWSWAAIDEVNRRAVFTIWDDRIALPKRDYIDLSWLNDPTRTENGAREFRRIISRVVDDGFDAYGIRCIARDAAASPRTRKSFDKDLLVLRIKLEAGKTIAAFVGKISPGVLTDGLSVADMLSDRASALDDLDAESVGNAAPQRKAYSGMVFVRDDKVRAKVIRRAKGKCEFCGALGFRKSDGTYYVEAHHIISLAEQGPDCLDNVIALCPNHHREAHFGEGRELLEAQFEAQLAKLRGKHCPPKS